MYARVLHCGRAMTTGSRGARHVDKIVGQASHHALRLRWIGSKPYQEDETEITDVFFRSPSIRRPSFTAFAKDFAAVKVVRLRGNISRLKN